MSLYECESSSVCFTRHGTGRSAPDLVRKHLLSPACAAALAVFPDAFVYCSPSRSSLMSGRLPYHVNQINLGNAFPGSGVPRNMTLIAAKLQSVGYRTHQIGKVSGG